MWGDISIAFLLAFITAFVVTPYTIRLANKVGAIDIPEKRRINEEEEERQSQKGSLGRAQNCLTNRIIHE